MIIYIRMVNVVKSVFLQSVLRHVFCWVFLDTKYRVHVFTGDEAGGGTNANVLLTIYGEHGDTGERKLDKSETHMDKFERNNVSCVDLQVRRRARFFNFSGTCSLSDDILNTKWNK